MGTIEDIAVEKSADYEPEDGLSAYSHWEKGFIAGAEHVHIDSGDSEGAWSEWYKSVGWGGHRTEEAWHAAIAWYKRKTELDNFKPLDGLIK